jgi:ubiquinone/menaquinone biosynthesis C-methylase UbiE
MLAFAGKRIKELGLRSTEAYKCDAADTKLPDGKFTNVFVSFGPIVFVSTLFYHTSSDR